MPTLEEITYEAGRTALSDQESVVAGVRQRTGTQLAAHALYAELYEQAAAEADADTLGWLAAGGFGYQKLRTENAKKRHANDSGAGCSSISPFLVKIKRGLDGSGEKGLLAIEEDADLRSQAVRGNGGHVVAAHDGSSGETVLFPPPVPLSRARGSLWLWARR